MQQKVVLSLRWLSGLQQSISCVVTAHTDLVPAEHRSSGGTWAWVPASLGSANQYITSFRVCWCLRTLYLIRIIDEHWLCCWQRVNSCPEEACLTGAHSLGGLWRPPSIWETGRQRFRAVLGSVLDSETANADNSSVENVALARAEKAGLTDLKYPDAHGSCHPREILHWGQRPRKRALRHFDLGVKAAFQLLEPRKDSQAAPRGAYNPGGWFLFGWTGSARSRPGGSGRVQNDHSQRSVFTRSFFRKATPAPHLKSDTAGGSCRSLSWAHQ